MLNIGITGQNGFIGTHVYNFFKLHSDKYHCIDFDRVFFSNERLLDDFVRKTDIIIHLAGLNRHDDPEELYSKNIGLTKKLIDSLERTGSKPHVIFSSSTQEELENVYGFSKRRSRQMWVEWSQQNDGVFSGLVIPNVFGPFGKPFYNSVIATFCFQLTHGESPELTGDGELKLIYIDDLVLEIGKLIDQQINVREFYIQHTVSMKVSAILEDLNSFKDIYFDKGSIPELDTKFKLNLFNTFRSFIDYKLYFPREYVQHSDERGNFAEIIRVGTGGQISFSTTVPGVTRGNHFHTRKIERFAVIKGSAVIQLRKIGSTEVIEFQLSGSTPSYVDMPVWYAHNITNVGTEDLYTIFWINEYFDQNDPDTFFEIV